MSKPLAIDLFCGLGGWTDGLLAEGWDVVGFDIERHVYGEHRYSAQLILQDVRTIHGAQLRNASLIVASSPCQEFSYRAMPWKRAKALGPPELGMQLFAQAERIQREAIAAAGRYIPMVQENVRGAQKYVGRARWHYGSFYLWGDVPALMPITFAGVKVGKHPGLEWSKYGQPGYVGKGFQEIAATKNTGGSWFNIGSPGQKVTNNNPARGDSVKIGGSWFHDSTEHTLRRHSSKSLARKAASARIAKIPEALARHIAKVYKPSPEAQAHLDRIAKDRREQR